jgi:hypothetical protein
LLERQELGHPAKMKAITAGKKKSDAIDALPALSKSRRRWSMKLTVTAPTAIQSPAELRPSGSEESSHLSRAAFRCVTDTH